MQAIELFPDKVGLEELLYDYSAIDMNGVEGARFRSLVDSLPVVVYEVQAEPPYSPAYISRYIESLGYSEEEWFTIPDLWLRLIHDDDRQRIMDETERAIRLGHDTDCEYRMVKRDGTVRWFHDKGRIVRDGLGKPVCWQGIMLDITERKQAEEALKASEKRYHDLIENAQDIIVTQDLEGHYTSVNKAGLEVTGYSLKEALEINPSEIIAPEFLQTAREMVASKLAGDEVTTYDLEIVGKDGGRIALEVNSRVIYQDGKPVGVQSIGRDVTERKRVEAALREANQRAIVEYERLLDRLATLAEDFGSARDLQTVYRAIRNFATASVPCIGLIISLYDPEEEVRRSVYLWYDGQELDTSDIGPARIGDGPAGRAIRTNSVITNNDYNPNAAKPNVVAIGFEEDSRTPRSILLAPMAMMGRVVGTIEVQSYEPGAYMGEHQTAMRMAGNLAANVIENVRLLEQERQTEEQFRQAQKMEAIGKLAGGVAHDFNNLLTAINGYSDLSIRRLEPGHPVRRNVEEIKKAGQRASNLTSQLLAFSRKQVLQPKVLNLNDVITDTSKMLRRLIGEDIEIALRLKPSLGRVKADPSQVDQVLMNLVVNARDAMPHGGMLTIETSNVEMDKAISDRYVSVKSGPHVMITVTDTGCGMTDDVKQHIFEPFFTTKGVGKGTGLGLSTVYGIVKQSDGYVSVESELGQGTTFKIYLPQVDDAEAADVKKVVEAPAPPRGTETILLVEDEEMVRNMTRTILESSGYKVLTAMDGKDALHFCESYHEKIDLMLTDVIMPHMSGKMLAEQVGPQRPEMRILYMSGYTDDSIVHHGALDEGIAFLPKPFTPDALAFKVREILDADAT